MAGAANFMASFGLDGVAAPNVGSSVTQATSKSTGVTITALTGQITTHNAALADATNVAFTVTNTMVKDYDTVTVNLASGNATAATYQVWAEAIAAGSFKIVVRNVSGGSLGEALVLNFTVRRGAIS